MLLIEVETGATIGASMFDATFSDLFAVQDSISERVARALVSKQTGDERKRIRKSYTGNAEAFQFHLKLWKRAKKFKS